MRLFKGFRPHPREEYKAAGLTNNGEREDYQGVIFDDGTVVVRWTTEHKSHSVWRDYPTFYKVHGHPEYGTRIEFVEAEKGAVYFIDPTAGDIAAYPRPTFPDFLTPDSDSF
jgi:hypothetical protein